MAPKKAAPPPEESPPEEEEAPEPEPVFSQKCLKVGGQVYYGICKPGTAANGGVGTFVRHGAGRQVTTAKNVIGEDVVIYTYQGNWKDNEMDGDGSFSWPDGSSYEGAFTKGEVHGYGRFTWPEGSSYTGDWIKGQMNGKGRFDSKFDGDFMEGAFHRDYFQDPRRGGRWVCITGEHQAAERKAIREGNPSTMPVRRCYDREALAGVLQGALEDGFVPFLVADESLPPSASSTTAAWAGDCGAMDASAAVRVSDVEVLRRRHGDYMGPFASAMRNALLSEQGHWMTLLWDDEELAELPAAWKLEHFLSAHSLPLEAFHPKLFNGRHMAVPFLPSELQEELDAHRRDPMASAKRPSQASRPGSTEPPPASEEAPPEEDGEGGVGIPAPSLPAPPKVYHLRFMVAALAKLAGGLTDDAVRDSLIRRYGGHMPLHRMAAVLLCAPVEEGE
eukprot:TRINITY_DN100998_c0_g1_i1.p1 TRINITY_DN100998_c0_g1~~TRINITY_DN100998_c0_g1_i1.p1  ORF type:complete len:447 (+),score=120.77 TRINITY_DN100998_c0_g1_i1:58-1398(+)